MSDSVQPHRRQPTRLSRPWDSPGKNTGVGCHVLLPCMKVTNTHTALPPTEVTSYMCVLVTQSCPTLCDLRDCSPSGSSVCGILQAGILKWAAISFSGIFPT